MCQGLKGFDIEYNAQTFQIQGILMEKHGGTNSDSKGHWHGKIWKFWVKQVGGFEQLLGWQEWRALNPLEITTKHFENQDQSSTCLGGEEAIRWSTHSSITFFTNLWKKNLQSMLTFALCHVLSLSQLGLDLILDFGIQAHGKLKRKG